MDVADVVTGALEQCDVVCLMYDSSDPTSFPIAASMMVSPPLNHLLSRDHNALLCQLLGHH